MTPRDSLGQTIGDADRVGAPIPVLLAVRDPATERALLQAGGDHPDAGFRIVGRALDATGLRDQIGRRQARAVIVSQDLPGLTLPLLTDLCQDGLVVLALTMDQEPLPDAWEASGVRAVATPVTPTLLTIVLRGAIAHREAPRLLGDPDPARAEEPRGTIVALFSGKGSSGRTTLAINLAVGLARLGQTVALVDADLSGGDVAAYLGLHPRANLFTLAHAARGHRDLSERIVAPEFQAGAGETRLRVLGGLPKPEMVGAITVPFLEALVRYLRRRYPVSIVDLAAPLTTGPDPRARAVLTQADRILFVCGGDLIAAWHGQQALRQLRAALGQMPASSWLVLNRHDRAWHPAPHEVAAALGWPEEPLATIPYDHHAVQAALREQRPLLDTRRPISRALEALARRVQRELSVAVPSGSEPQLSGKVGTGWRPRVPFGRRSR